MKTILMVLLLFPLFAFAEQEMYSIVIRDHKFQPDEIVIPAGKKVRLLVENQDATPEEFDSHDLNREKVIGGKSKASIFIGPLEPGRYLFAGEFNAKTAQGAIIAR